MPSHAVAFIAFSTLAASLFTGTSVTAGTSPAPGFYVSAAGSDSSNGSAAHPFRTLGRAVTAMQGSSIHTTYVETGTYNLSSTLYLSGANSGLTITAAAGAKVIINGNHSLQTLIQLNGATGVTLRGLEFTGANGQALILDHASSNRIVGNLFTNNGEGMLLRNSASRNVVSGNQVNKSSTSAIEAQDGSSYNTFDSNLINGTGAVGTAGGGFFFHGVNYNKISQNLVENTAGIGIGVLNWDNNTINVGNVITNNVVKNTNLSSQSTDSGAIYELGRSQVNTKSVISNNYISGPTTAGAGSGAHIVGIYLDDYTDGVQVTNNIVATINMHGLQIHCGSNITISNNVFDLGSSGHSAILLQSTYASAMGTPQPMTNNVIKKNIIASSESNPIAFDNISGGTPTISNNFYMDLKNGHFQMNGFSQSAAVYGNAMFANEAAGNYTLGTTSGAHKIGFASIDESVMGPHPTTAHWYGDLGRLT